MSKNVKLVSLLIIVAIFLIAITTVSASDVLNNSDNSIVTDNETVTNDIPQTIDLEINKYSNDSINVSNNNEIEYVITCINSTYQLVTLEQFRNMTNSNSTFTNNTAGSSGGSISSSYGNITSSSGLSFNGHLGYVSGSNFANGLNNCAGLAITKPGTITKPLPVTTTTEVATTANSVKYDVNTNLNSNLNTIGSPKLDVNFNSSIKRNNSSDINFNGGFYANNHTTNNSEKVSTGFKFDFKVGNYEIDLDMGISYTYSTVKSSDVNIIDSSFLNSTAYSNYNVIVDNGKSEYNLFDLDYLNTVICKNTTTEIINSAVTVYESNFARNSLLRITNESVVGNSTIGILTLSQNCKTINDTLIYSIGVSIADYKILSESFAINNSYNQSNIWLTTNICKHAVNDCLMISKNKIEYDMTIDDSLVIEGNLQ